MQLHSGQIWFDESAWVGAELEFPDCEVTRWKITSKISEKEDFRQDSDAERQNPVFSTARAVFVCCDPNNPTHEAILKVRLQYVDGPYPYLLTRNSLTCDRIPKWQTWSEPASVRAEQASSALSYTAVREITALKRLMEANCSSTPKLIASEHQLQGDSDFVPGGYKDFLLMERVPGEVPGDGGFLENVLPTDEWTEIETAFKKAWL